LTVLVLGNSFVAQFPIEVVVAGNDDNMRSPNLEFSGKLVYDSLDRVVFCLGGVVGDVARRDEGV
jgi:hypothetical protein